MSLINSFWNQFLTKLIEIKGERSVAVSILKQIKPIELKEKEIVVGCQSLAIKKYLDSKINSLNEILKVLKTDLNIVFVVLEKNQNKKKDITAPLLSFEPPLEDVFVRVGLNKKYSFENFAVSSTNQVAYAACQAVVKNPGVAYNPLFLYGGVGVGKTHLAQATAKKILENNLKKKVLFCPGDNFTNELIEAIRDKTTQKFRKKYRGLDLLIVDDIQFIAGKVHIQEEFFHTFNAIVSVGGQIILTSDKPPQLIRNLEERLKSRFSGGLTIDIQPPDFELRSAILLIKAKEKNINIDIEAAKVIAEKITDSRALEGVLLSIYAKTLEKKEIIDLEEVEGFFSQTEETKKQKKITAGDIINTVSTYYNIKKSHLKGPGREERVALTRQIVMFLMRKILGLKLEEIALYLKRKDHTTILHGYKKISQMIMKDQNFKKEIDNLLQSLE